MYDMMYNLKYDVNEMVITLDNIVWDVKFCSDGVMAIERHFKTEVSAHKMGNLIKKLLDGLSSEADTLRETRSALYRAFMVIWENELDENDEDVEILLDDLQDQLWEIHALIKDKWETSPIWEQKVADVFNKRRRLYVVGV